MDTFVEFLLNNYIWFLVMALIIIFALIGYLVDITNPNNEKKFVKPIAPVAPDTKKHVHPSVSAYTNEDFDEPLIDEKNTL